MQITDLNLEQCAASLTRIEECYQNGRGQVDLMVMSRDKPLYTTWVNIRKRQSELRKQGALKDVKFVAEGN